MHHMHQTSPKKPKIEDSDSTFFEWPTQTTNDISKVDYGTYSTPNGLMEIKQEEVQDENWCQKSEVKGFLKTSEIQNSGSRSFPVSKLRPEDVPMYCQETINRILNISNVDSDTKRVTRSGTLKRPHQESPKPSILKTLNSPVPEDVTLDTKSLLEDVEKSRKRLKISQVEFAEKILARSQGTYSDLRKQTKSWDEMKSGRAIFVRMYNWLKASDEEKLEMLEDGNGVKRTSSPSPNPKRARYEFTDRQKDKLYKIFSESKYPSPEKKTEISKSMNLPVESVDNFFQNARSRKCQK